MGASFKQKSIMAFASILVCMLLTSSPALSEIKRLGDNLSRAVPGSGNTTMRICDGERDGRRAYARYYRQGLSYPFLVIDTSGNNGDCVDEDSDRQIVRHQTCEARGNDIGGGDDRCTTFSDHS